jgi:hypothetical protein
MDNLLKGLNLIAEGIELIKSATSSTAAAAEPTAPAKSKKSAAAKSAPAAAPAAEEAEDDFGSMTFSALKKLAKSKGLSTDGTREEVEARLRGEEPVEDEDEDEEPAEEEKPVRGRAAKPAAAKKSKKQPEPEPEDEDEEDESDDEGEEEEDDEDPDAAARAALADMSVEQIASALADAGISAKGKRESLESKFIKAVNDGLISIESDEDDSDEDEDSDEDSDEDEDSDDEESENTEARSNALEEMEESIKDDFENKKLSRKTINTFLKNRGYDLAEVKALSDDDALTTYVDEHALFIDDEGVDHIDDEDKNAYYVGGEAFCCGAQLEYNAKKKSYFCPTCKSTYGEE